jgi:cell division transport system ATP-binding protein
MIELDGVSIAFQVPDRNVRGVLENVTLRIGRGEMVYLVGPSGSGKSTLLRLLYMDVYPQRGRVRVGEYDSKTIRARQIPYLRRQLGVVFQDYQLLPDRSVFDNVAFALYATGHSGRAVKNRVFRVLSQVGLSHKLNSKPHELSGGEQQRVCLARAIANEPDVLLADEPTGNLDPIVAGEIQKLIVGLHRQGMTVIMATHDYRLVRDYPARTLAFVRGQLMEVNPVSLQA